MARDIVMNGFNLPALTLPQLVLQHGGAQPDSIAIRQKASSGWSELTWREYADRALACAAGLLQLGLEQPRHVAIFAEGRSEWVIAQTAVGLTGGVAFGCYPTSSSEDLRHALTHGDAQMVICENAAFLEKVEAVSGDLPNLTHVILMDPPSTGQWGSRVLSFEALQQVGSEALSWEPHMLDRLVMEQSLDDIGLLVYTSGSTGSPKGALLTYRNMRAAAEGLLPGLGLGPGSVVLSYLPLCHIAEQSMTNFGPLFAGSTACFGGGLATLLEDLRAVRPTFFSGVPRVWQKIKDEIVRRFGELGQATELQAALKGTPPAALMAAARAIVGLDRASVVTSGAAPLQVETSSFLRALGFPLLELYGMTEACSVVTIQRPDGAVPGCVGEPVGTVDLKLADDGEILVRGENVFAGYYKDPDATLVALEGGWLHTGDVGAFDHGQLRIIDRKKDIMITDGGKNIAPAEIEGLMRSSPLIQECVLVADRRNYVAALIQIDTTAAGGASDNAAHAKLARDPAVQARVAGEIRRLNEVLARVAQVKRAVLLDEPLSHSLGDLTPTLKLRRFKVHQRYGLLIEDIYAGRAGFDIYPQVREAALLSERTSGICEVAPAS